MPSESARDRIELVSWALLALATVGSAWCAYQASLWNGEQIRHLARASVAQFASSRKTTIANRDLTIDAATFINYVSADVHGDKKMVAFLRDHARPEFRPALAAWIASKEAGRQDPPNPFLGPDYHVRAAEEATALDEQAGKDIAISNAANGNNDIYVLHTVLFALSLFFLGATAEVRRSSGRKLALAFGALVYCLTTISVARLPRAPATLPRQVKHTSGEVFPG